jgi:hypothetical protein
MIERKLPNAEVAAELRSMVQLTTQIITALEPARLRQ